MHPSESLGMLSAEQVSSQVQSPLTSQQVVLHVKYPGIQRTSFEIVSAQVKILLRINVKGTCDIRTEITVRRTN